MMKDLRLTRPDFACLQPLVKAQDENLDYYHFRSSDPSLRSISWPVVGRDLASQRGLLT